MTRVGVLLLAVGGAGLVFAVVLGDGGHGVIAACSAVLVAAGMISLGSGWRGHFGTRVAGALLFVGAIVVLISDRLAYWLPTGWGGPVTAVAALVAVAGLASTIVGGFQGLRLGGLSAAFGLVALAAYVLSTVSLPDIGSYDRDVLRVSTSALGALAVTTGLGAVGRRARHRTAWHAATAAVAVLAALLVWRAGVVSYSIYAPADRRAAIIVITAVGAVSALALGAALGVLPALGQQTVRVPAPVTTVQAPVEVEESVPADDVSPPTVAPSVAAEVTAPPATRSSQLQTLATVVGLVSGIIAIGKELVAAVRALLS